MLGLAVLVAACSEVAEPEVSADRCPEAQGEFPPTDCAILEGVAVGPDGTALAGLAVRVDSFVPGRGYAYTSNAGITDASGAFRLVVFRVNRLEPVTVPDSATVEVKSHDQPNPKAGRRRADGHRWPSGSRRWGRRWT